MAIDIEVIFTGLCLFCLNTPGSMCEGKDSGFVYLVNGTEDAKVCGHQLDGGHRPRIAFDEEFLLPGSRQDHTVEPSPDGHRVVVSSLQGIELCIRTEHPPQSGSQGAASSQLTSGGAKPVAERPIGNRKRPWPFFNDADSFDWIVDLTDMSEEAESLCPQVNGPLADNKLVTARVRLDKGVVRTADKWHDSWGPWWLRWSRRLLASDYLIWNADPPEHQSRFPKALPGKAAWRIEDVPEDAVVLVEDCHDKDTASNDIPRTLFRLRPTSAGGQTLKLHITNAPDKKVGAPGHAHLEHFRWYYRLVDWGHDGCTDLNATGCPSNLPVPVPPDSARPKGGDVIEGVITETNKCPPGSAGSG